MKTLLAVDGSAYTEKMVAYLESNPDFLGASCSVTVLSVLPEMPVRSRAAIGAAAVDRYYREDAAAVLEPVTRRLEAVFDDLTAEWKIGPIAKTIADRARAGKFDLIVMGSHGHNPLANLVMGSVTTRVLARSQVPLLIIR